MGSRSLSMQTETSRKVQKVREKTRSTGERLSSSESQVTLAPSETKTELHPGWTDECCSQCQRSQEEGDQGARGGLCCGSQAPPHPCSVLCLSQTDCASSGTKGAGDCSKSPFWSDNHQPSWFLPRPELELCNWSVDGLACRAVCRSTGLPWRLAVPGVSLAGAPT